jgi:hypothetical protein
VNDGSIEFLIGKIEERKETSKREEKKGTNRGLIPA